MWFLGNDLNFISRHGLNPFTHTATVNNFELLKFVLNTTKINIDTTDELGNTALFFASDLSKSVTGEIHYVDCGFNIIGMPNINI